MKLIFYANEHPLQMKEIYYSEPVPKLFLKFLATAKFIHACFKKECLTTHWINENN